MKEQQINDIISNITDAMKVALGDKWKKAAKFAQSEARTFAHNLAEINKWKVTGEITEEEAKVLIRMHQRSMKMVLTSLEGISLVMVERAINSALDAIGDMVNGIIGWDIIR